MHNRIRHNIHALMVLKGITHEKTLAHEAGVEQSKLNRYLSGKIQEPGLEFLMKLSTFFEVPLDQFVSVELPSECHGSSVPSTYTLHPTIAETIRVMESLPETYRDAVLASASALAASAGKNQGG